MRDLIDATPWIDTHEHLVEEAGRLSERVVRVEGADVLPPDWAALIADYCCADLVSAGLPTSAVPVLLGDSASPLEKWDLAAPYLELVRTTGYVRAVDITTERLFGYYERLLHEEANVARCQVNSLEVDVFCETAMPQPLQQDLQRALERLVARGWISLEQALRLVPLLMHGNAERVFPPRLADGSAWAGEDRHAALD